MDIIAQKLSENYVARAKDLGKEFFELQEICHPFNQLSRKGRAECTGAKINFFNRLIDGSVDSVKEFDLAVEIASKLDNK